MEATDFEIEHQKRRLKIMANKIRKKMWYAGRPATDVLDGSDWAMALDNAVDLIDALEKRC